MHCRELILCHTDEIPESQRGAVRFGHGLYLPMTWSPDVPSMLVGFNFKVNMDSLVVSSVLWL